MCTFIVVSLLCTRFYLARNIIFYLASTTFLLSIAYPVPLLDPLSSCASHQDALGVIRESAVARQFKFVK